MISMDLAALTHALSDWTAHLHLETKHRTRWRLRTGLRGRASCRCEEDPPLRGDCVDIKIWVELIGWARHASRETGAKAKPFSTLRTLRRAPEGGSFGGRRANWYQR